MPMQYLLRSTEPRLLNRQLRSRPHQGCGGQALASVRGTRARQVTCVLHGRSLRRRRAYESNRLLTAIRSGCQNCEPPRATRRDQPGSRACRRLQRRPQGTRVRHPSGPRPRRRSPSLGKEGPATLSALPSGSRLDGATIAQYVLGRVTLCSDEFAEAIHQFSESLALWRETGDARTAPAAVAGLSRSRRALAQDPGEGVYTLILEHACRCMSQGSIRFTRF